MAQEELPADSVILHISEEDCIGSGGSGEVYLADFGGINAAAKVICVF